MSTASTSVCVTGGFFDRFQNIIFNPDHLLEGSVWAGWFGWTVYDVSSAFTNQQEAYSLPDTSTAKTEKIWNANKNLFLSACGSISSSSMLFAWAEKVGLIMPGIFGPIFGVIGFGGSSLASFIRLIDAFQELNDATIAWDKAVDPRDKADIALNFGVKMTAIAFFVCVTAWGVLGAAQIILGGLTLAVAVDTLFKYTIITFLAYFGAVIGVGLLVNDSKNLTYPDSPNEA